MASNVFVVFDGLFYFSLKKVQEVKNKQGFLLTLQVRSRSQMLEVMQRVKMEALFSAGKDCWNL